MSISELARLSAPLWNPATPAPESDVVALRMTAGIDFPPDYLEFLRFSDGGCGCIPVQPWYFDGLWKAKEVVEFNHDYQIPIYCPGFFGIGSSGGGEIFAFDMRRQQPWPVVAIPGIGMEPDAVLQVAEDFRSFVAMFGQEENPNAR